MKELGQFQQEVLHKNFLALTGFRGVAIIWVIFAHLPVHLPYPIDLFQHRWGIGVDLFLAVSGFLVTRSFYQCALLAEKSGAEAKWGAIEFLVRRVGRIFPPYYITVGLIAALALFVDASLRVRMGEISDIIWSFPLFYSNYTIPFVTDRIPAFLIMTWSLSFQEQFYAVLVIFFLISRRFFGHLILAMAIVSMLSRFYLVFFHWEGEGNHSSQLQMWLNLRFDAVAWSCLAWIHIDKLRALWLKHAKLMNIVIVVGLFSVLMAHAFIGGDLAQSIIYCFKGPILALLVYSLIETDQKDNVIARVLKHPRLGLIGLAAYEIYLLNTIIVAAVTKLGIQNPWIFSSVIFVLSLAAGLIFYSLIGRPAKKWVKKYLSPFARSARA